MKAISLWQPHASLLVLPSPDTGRPLKRYETRHWPAPRGLIGCRIAIHAAKNRTEIQDLAEFWDDPDDEFAAAVHDLGFVSPAALPLGAIVGSAVLAACHRTEDLIDPGVLGDFSEGRFAWEMADTRPLAQPVPFRGMQGFFDVPDDLFREAA